MKAMLIRHYGGPEVLEYGEMDTPRPGPGQVLVKVHGSSVNPVDCAIRSGTLKLFVRLKLPAVLGIDLSGEVVERGPGASRFNVGDRVFAYTGLAVEGGYGEYAAVPEECLARVPDRLDLVEAGSVPGVGMTAYEAFTVHAQVKPGMRVFINGAAGGVGTYAVQVAKALGAETVGTCSAAKAELVRGLGADRTIDYAQGNPFSEKGAYDVVLNAVRGARRPELMQMLRRGGTLVSITDGPQHQLLARLTNPFRSTRWIPFLVSSRAACLEGLASMMEAGKVRPVIERTYPLRELAEAQRRVETGRVAGKLCISVAEPPAPPRPS